MKLPCSVNRTDLVQEKSAIAHAVQQVLHPKPLARAIALALVVGGTALPASSWAATIQGKLFYDLNGNATLDPCEIPVTSRKVYYRINDGYSSYTRTDSSGQYSISAEIGDSVSVSVDLPSSETVTTSQNSVVTVGQNTQSLNFGINTSDFQNAAPTASLGIIPSTVDVNTPVNFTATFSDPTNDSMCSSSSPQWNFGDGQTADGLNVSHTYTKAGTYTAQISVRDQWGAEGKAQVAITVKEPGQPKAQVPSSVDFGNQLSGSNAYKDVTVSNTGNAPLSIGQIQTTF